MKEFVSDLGLIRDDDQYLDILGAGDQPDGDVLTELLASWRNEGRSGE